MLLCADVRAQVLEPARYMPADVDTYIVIDNASDLLDSGAGAAIVGIGRALFAEGAAAGRWAEFASQLDWSTDKAFDALFGRRVTLVGRDPWGRDASWALLCEVSRDTERRLRAGLKVAPRKVFQGHTIYAVENGRFELTFEGRRGGTTVLVAPSERLDLFNELVPLLRRPPEHSLAQTRALRGLARLEGDAAAIYSRLPEPKGGWVGARVSQRGNRSLDAEVTAPYMGGGGEEIKWSASIFDRLAAGAVMCVVECRGPLQSDQLPLSPGLLELLPWMTPSPELDDALGDLHAVVATPGDSGGMHVAAGVQWSDRQAMPVAGDRLMRELAITLSTTLGAGAWDVDFGGRFPDATRSAPLLDEGAPLIPGDGLELVWRYVGLHERGGSAPGWLVMATDRAALCGVADALVGSEDERDGKVAPWLSIGLVRPAEMREAVEKAISLPRPLELLRFVEEASWRLRRQDVDAVRGQVEVRFAPPGD